MSKLWQKMRMIQDGEIPGPKWTDPLSLSFPVESEIAFMDFFFKLTLTRFRPALVMGMSLYSLFFLLDYWWLPEVKNSLFLIRFGLVVPIGFAIYLVSYHEIFRRFYQLFSMAYMLAAGIGIVMMTLIRPHYTETYYVGIILVLIFIYILSGLRFYWATATGGLIVVSYIIGIQWVTGADWLQHIDNYFFLVSSNVLLMLGGYFMEVFYRREFLLQYQLTLEREKIKQVNVGLEARVLDRTKKLQEEVIERKGAQETAQNALEQKEILLREVYHRTKNNMNVVISLLNMQSAEQHKRPVEDAFAAISDRIYSMSLVHEQLYRSEDLSTIRFDEYIRTLASRLHYSMPPSPSNIQISYDCEAIEIGLAQAVPLGLAVNEIITNAFKHGFPADRKGHIQIHMKKNIRDNLQIEISNDGLVFQDDVNIENPKTLGLHLIKMLIQDQLQSELTIESNGDVRYKIELLPPED